MNKTIALLVLSSLTSLASATNPTRKLFNALCYTHNIEQVKEALQAGANLQVIITKEGDTPLHIAASKGLTDIVQLLLDAGADINARNYKGFTPLHYAILNERIGVVTLLISRGADVNAHNNIVGCTPLHYAAVRGNSDIVQLLLTAESDITLRNHTGKTALDIANQDKRKQEITCIIQNYIKAHYS